MELSLRTDTGAKADTLPERRNQGKSEDIMANETTAAALEAGTFPEKICFQGKYRSSQLKMIESLLGKLQTQTRVCAVVAPGSGKSFIGLVI